MNELDIINKNYDLKSKMIKIEYEPIIPKISYNSCHYINCQEENENIKEKFKEMSLKLQENEKNRTNEIKEYYKRKNEKILQMSDRELLEEIYRLLTK